MSAAEKLKALEAAMTDAPWTPSSSDYEAVPYFVWDYYLDEDDAAGVITLRNALSQIVAVVEAAEQVPELRYSNAQPSLTVAWSTKDLRSALAALNEQLT